jgi:hypothetical protein
MRKRMRPERKRAPNSRSFHALDCGRLQQQSRLWCGNGTRVSRQGVTGDLVESRGSKERQVCLFYRGCQSGRRGDAIPAMRKERTKSKGHQRQNRISTSWLQERDKAMYCAGRTEDLPLTFWGRFEIGSAAKQRKARGVKHIPSQ